jgi:hypothetical protein
MNSWGIRSIIVIFSSLPVWSCSSSNQGGASLGRDPATVTVPDNVTESDYKALAAEFACYALGPCCAASGYAYNESTCRATYATFLNADANIQRTYNSTNATRCLRDFQTNSHACDGKTSAVCNQVYSGVLPLGAACKNDADCASSLDQDVKCDISDSICVASIKGTLGDACDQTCTSAAEGIAYCSGVFSAKDYPTTAFTHVACDRTDGLTCRSTTFQCVSLGGTGTSCSSLGECVIGHYCDVSGSVGTCTPRLPAGQPCPKGASQCALDAYCDDDFTCRSKKNEGAACGSSEECLGSCQEGTCSRSTVVEALSNAFTGLFCGGERI